MAIIFPEGTQNFPAHHGLRLVDWVCPGSTASQTDGDLVFVEKTGLTRLHNDNHFLIQGGCMWYSSNPNGYWELEQSTDGGSNWSDVSAIFEADEPWSSSGNVFWFTYSVRHDPGTTSSMAYRLVWRHVAQNGGTMYRNRPGSTQSWTRNYNADSKGGTFMTIYEIMDWQ